MVSLIVTFINYYFIMFIAKIKYFAFFIRCNDNMCVPDRWRCDKQKDCKGGEDEVGCDVEYSRTCSPEEFSCNDGRCILVNYC